MKSQIQNIGMAMIVAGSLALFNASAFGQLSMPVGSFKDSPVPVGTSNSDVVLPHFRDGRLWVSGQTNFIFRTHPGFKAKYSGPNSLVSNYEKATSRVMTLYTGLPVNSSTEVVVHIEEAGGNGLSTALGLAGFSNLDVVRNPTLSSAPYLARGMVHKVFALSSEQAEAERGPLSTFSELPVRRLELRAGKFGTADFFDVNSVGSDSHLQFMNWSTAQNGAYDYSADTRGYTWGVLAEYQGRTWALRFSESLMPTVANGLNMEWSLRKAHSENVEYELRRGLLPKKQGAVRLLNFVNHANMGVYKDAVEAYLSGQTTKPDITAHPWKTTAKYGFGINVEQCLTHNLTAYPRYGWNDGKTESLLTPRSIALFREVSVRPVLNGIARRTARVSLFPPMQFLTPTRIILRREGWASSLATVRCGTAGRISSKLITRRISGDGYLWRPM